MTEERTEPKKPKLYPFYDKKTKRIYWVPAMTKQNPYQQAKLTKRLGEQIDSEGHNKYGRLQEEYEFDYIRSLRRQGIRHRTVPLNGGIVVIISDLGNIPFPCEPAKRKELLKEWIANMSRKFGGTRDYGKENAGFRFDPIEPGRYIMLTVTLTPDDIKCLMDVDGTKWSPTATGDISIDNMSTEDAEAYVRNTFVMQRN